VRRLCCETFIFIEKLITINIITFAYFVLYNVYRNLEKTKESNNKENNVRYKRRGIK